MKKFLFLTLFLTGWALASGTVNTIPNYERLMPAKSNELRAEDFRCKENEALKDCEARFQDARKNSGKKDNQ